MTSRMIVVTTVSAELNRLEKRFAFTHSRGGSFGVSGGSAIGTVAVAATLPNSLIYRSTSLSRTLNQFTTTEMVSEVLR